jgi:hypothetical protein
LVSDELLELAVFPIQETPPLGVTDFHTAKFLLPLVVGGLADAVAPAEFLNGRASARSLVLP